MDERALEQDLSALDPGALTGLRYLGVYEVARAKGQDYLTVVYDLASGDLIWVTEGRRAAGLIAFFYQLDEPVAQSIEAMAMDMWKPFETAVRQTLPNAAIVFDRFHVMQQYSKVIDQVRRAEFKRAPKADKKEKTPATAPATPVHSDAQRRGMRPLFNQLWLGPLSPPSNTLPHRKLRAGHPSALRVCVAAETGLEYKPRR